MVSERNITPMYQVILHFFMQQNQPLCFYAIYTAFNICILVHLSDFSEAHVMKNLQSFASAMRRRLLSETDNLPALLGNDAKSSDPQNPKEIQRPVDVISLGSGSFSAFPGIYGDALTPLLPEDIDATAVQQLSTEVAQSTDVETTGTKNSKWAYIITIPAVILLIGLIVLIILVLRKRGRASVAPWKTGLSGPIQKALVTGETLLLFYLILHLGRECMQSLKRVTFCIGNYTKITSLCNFCEALVVETPRFSWWVKIWPIQEFYLCF